MSREFQSAAACTATTSTPKNLNSANMGLRNTKPRFDLESLDISYISGTEDEEAAADRLFYADASTQIITLTDKEYKKILELCRSRVFTSPTGDQRASVLVPEITDVEKQQRIQQFIDSITPNRVDYTKSPKFEIISHTITAEKPNTPPTTRHELRISFYRGAPPQSVLQRVDYNKNEELKETPQRKRTALPRAAKTPRSEASNTGAIQPVGSRKRLTRRRRQNRQLLDEENLQIAIERSLSDNVEFLEPIINLSTINDESGNRPQASNNNESTDSVFDDVNLDWLNSNSMNVTLRKNKSTVTATHSPVLDSEQSIVEVQSLDDSIQIVDVTINVENATNNSGPRTRSKKRSTPTVVEVIDLCDSPPKKRRTENDRPLDVTCPICLEQLCNKEVSATLCGHIYCTPCIREAIKAKKNCPKCRTALTLKKIHPLFINN